MDAHQLAIEASRAARSAYAARRRRRSATQVTRAHRAAFLFCLFASNVSADSPAIHVYVEAPRAGEARKYARAEGGDEAEPTAVTPTPSTRRPIRSRLAPETFVYGAPPSSASAPTPAPASASAPDSLRAPEREATFAPDLDTGPEPVTSYVEVFSPATGRKRFAAFDRVNDDGSLAIADDTLLDAPRVASRDAPPRPGTTRFTGDIRIGLRAGVFVPIPSVAAGARLVDATVEPPAKLVFAIDSAENWSVRANRDGIARLIYRLDAPDAYFGPTIAPDIDWSEIPAAMRPALGASIASDAAAVLKTLKVSRDQSFDYVVKALTTHFREFEPGELSPSASGSAYRRIALGRVGICRHRAYAFMVTAHALGIPTRVVTNEAHVFVEVFVPRLAYFTSNRRSSRRLERASEMGSPTEPEGEPHRWVGIDLGGGAQSINEYGISGRPLYIPPSASTFEWPAVDSATGPIAGQPTGPSPLATMHSALPAGPRPSVSASAPAPATASATASAPAPARPFVGVPARVSFTWRDAPRTANPGAAIFIAGRITTATGEPVPRAFVTLTASGRDGATPLFTLGPFPSGPDGRVNATAVIPDAAAPASVTFSTRITLP